jgi:hypothetical protein
MNRTYAEEIPQPPYLSRLWAFLPFLGGKGAQGFKLQVRQS